METLERELENLKSTEQIKEWSVSLGYGDAEYTVEIGQKNSSTVKILAKNLNQKYGAHTFVKYQDGKNVSIKFVVNLV